MRCGSPRTTPTRLLMWGTATCRWTTFPELSRTYEKVVQRDDTCAIGHYNLGSACHARRDLDKAARHFSRTISLEPGYADAHFNLGIVHQERGRLEEALRCYDEAARSRFNTGGRGGGGGLRAAGAEGRRETKGRTRSRARGAIFARRRRYSRDRRRLGISSRAVGVEPAATRTPCCARSQSRVLRVGGDVATGRGQGRGPHVSGR